MKYIPLLQYRYLKSILFLLLVLAVSFNSKAEVVFKGLSYELDELNKTAEVTIDEINYTGEVKIPSKIVFNNITYTVISIGKGAFANCSEITSVTIPNSVTSIVKWAFYNCPNLMNVSLPKSVTSIGEGAFMKCSSLSSVIIPNSVTSIEEGTFMGCISLRRVTIPNSVTSIGKGAFADCSELTSVTIPSSVTSIESYAFGRCSKLTSVTIPNSVTFIGKGAFYNCPNLTNVTFPNSVLAIEEGTFFACRSLTSLTIPNSVTSIGTMAFTGCRELMNVIIPYSVTSIGEGAFANCTRLKNVRIPPSVEEIGSDVFPEDTKIELFEGSRGLVKNFPSNEISYYKLQPISWDEVNRKILSWDDFYEQHKKAKLTYKTAQEIEEQINRELSAWQTKDEFESTAEWQERVNETTREQKAEELSKKYLEIYATETKKIQDEQEKLAEEYEEYKDRQLTEYYYSKEYFAEQNFRELKFELKPYDADNGSFMISSPKFGDILLPVPKEEAKAFKENWNEIAQNMQPVFVPDGKEVALNKIIFQNGTSTFIYDSNTKANYSVADIKYNFQPVQIAEISEKDLNISTPAPASNLDSKVISNSASDVLTVQNVTPGRTEIAATTRSDVDYSIPKSPTDSKTNTFAIIIANENYNSVSKVPYAAKDGEILEKYLTQAVGLPKDHVKFYKNASFGNMAAAMKHAENLSEAFGSDLNLIFYYAGHGMPNEKTKNPMLIPVDGDAAMPETCRDLGEIIATLGGLNAGSVVVMLDACFSGTERGDGMLMAARGIRIRSNQAEPMGNMVIISASQGDETAYPYDAEQHGLFTYFLLRKLQENKGDVTLGELADYVTEQVKRQSVVSNGKLQTPTVSVSPSFQSAWRSAKLK